MSFRPWSVQDTSPLGPPHPLLDFLFQGKIGIVANLIGNRFVEPPAFSEHCLDLRERVRRFREPWTPLIHIETPRQNLRRSRKKDKHTTLFQGCDVFGPVDDSAARRYDRIFEAGDLSDYLRNTHAFLLFDHRVEVRKSLAQLLR